MRCKRAQVSEQFNWLFAIVAGSIILIFFLFVIGQLKATSDIKLSTKVLQNFDAILAGSSVAPNSLNIIDSSKLLAFDISCDSDGYSDLRILKSRAKSLDLSQKFIYSPFVAEGSRLYLYVVPITNPFNIGNALLLTGDNVIFVEYLTQNSDLQLDEFFKLLPDNISKMRSVAFDKNLKSFDKIVIISKEDPVDFDNREAINGVKNLLKKDVTWIKVKFADKDVQHASVYTKSEKARKFSDAVELNVPSNDFALFLTFSKNPEFYKCNLRKINIKVKTISRIFLKKVQLLSSNVDSNDCKLDYAEAEDILNKIISSRDIFGISDQIEYLKEINHNLLLKSCPLIY